MPRSNKWGYSEWRSPTIQSFFGGDPIENTIGA